MSRYDPEFQDRLIEAQDAFVWEVPEHERHERGPRWYVAMGLIALLFTGYAVWTNNFLFAFIVLLSAIILVIAGNERPRRMLVQIGDNGLVYNGEFFGFDELHQFAIVYQPPNIKVLYVYPKGALRPRMRILLGEQNPIELRNHLLQYLQEDLNLRDEHASDILAKVFKL